MADRGWPHDGAHDADAVNAYEVSAVKNPIFQEGHLTLQRLGANQEERRLAEAYDKALRDWNTIAGVERPEGRQETRLEAARSMLGDNMPHERVAKYAGLPLEAVERLVSELSI